jgi:hypothetical protein
MNNDLINRYADLVGQHVAQVNPHEANTLEHALYEVGLLRAIVAQCILQDNKMKAIMMGVVDGIEQSRAVKDTGEAPVRIIRSSGK